MGGVLAQIVIKLAPHVSFVCKVKREGTILYRNNGDIMCALSHSLAENKNQQQHRSLSHDVRTVYALGVLLFTINSQCCVPLHLPLTFAMGAQQN